MSEENKGKGKGIASVLAAPFRKLAGGGKSNSVAPAYSEPGSERSSAAPSEDGSMLTDRDLPNSTGGRQVTRSRSQRKPSQTSIKSLASLKRQERRRKASTTSTLSTAGGGLAPKRGWHTLKATAQRVKKTDINTDPDYGPAFASFVPRLLHLQIASQVVQRPDEPDPTFEGAGACITSAVLFADASGFTALTEKLAKAAGSSASGAESMCRIINNFFTVLIDVVQLYGGDVIKFSGDALTVVFPVISKGGVDAVFAPCKTKGDSNVGNPDAIKKVTSLVDQKLDIKMEIKATFSADIKTACLRATQCSLALHQAVLEYSQTDADASGLSLHTCVGYGDVTLVHLGGVFGRYEYVMAGQALDQIAEAEHHSESLMTVLSREVTQLIGDQIKDGEQVGPEEAPPSKGEDGGKGAAADHGYYGLISVKELKKEVKPPLQLTNTRVTKAIAQLLMRYIPGAVSRKLMAGHVGLIAELREVSVLFIHTEGVNLTAESNGGIDEATTLGQNLMLEIQKSIFQYEGSINKMAIDDKGLVTIAVFGLPPLPHDDDPLRAVRAAKALVAALPERLGDHVKCSVGISSGQTFCGVVGSQKRREYTVMGDMVNLAARLMSMAPKLGHNILVDESTYKHSAENFGYDTSIPPTKLKGKAKPVKLYAPTNDKLGALEEEVVGIMGRHTERCDLRNMVGSLCTFHHGGTLLLTGDQGSGRPALVNQLQEIVEDAGMVLLRRAKKEKDKKKRSSASAEGSSVADEASLPKPKKKSSSTAIGIVKVSSADFDGPGATLAPGGPSDSPRQPRTTIIHRVDTIKELKKQANNITDEIVDEGEQYKAWIPILDSMVEHIAYDKKTPLDDKGKLVEVVLEMLSAEMRLFAYELNDIIPVLGHAIPRQEGYRDNDRKPKILRRMGLMILELVKAYGKQHNLVIVLHLRVGDTEKTKKQDMYSWELAQTLGRWLKHRSMYKDGKGKRKLSTTSEGMTLEEKEWKESPEWRGMNNMLLCITCSPLVRQNHFAPPVLDLLDMAEKTGTSLQLKPFDHSKRDKYLVDVLRQNHGYQQVLQTARAHVPQLIDFVSDYASGVPKYIEELLGSLFEQGVVSTVEKDLAEGGMVGLKIENKFLLHYSQNDFQSMDATSIAQICTMPKKLVGKANERFERLNPRKKIILKYASTMKHFSIRMLRVLMAAEEEKLEEQRTHTLKRSTSVSLVAHSKAAAAGNASGALTLTIPHAASSISSASGGIGKEQSASLLKMRSESAESTMGHSAKMPLDGQLKELVNLCVLETVDTIDALNYIRLHDPQAKVGYTFQCKLQQLQVRSGLLGTQKESWSTQMAEMRQEAHSSRSIGLKQYGSSVRNMPAALRASAQFRAQETITLAIDKRVSTMRLSHLGDGGGPSGALAGSLGEITFGLPDSAAGDQRRGSVSSSLSQRSSQSADLQFPLTMPYKDQVVEGCLSVFNDMLDKMESKLSQRGAESASGEELYDSMEAFKETSRALMTTTLHMLEGDAMQKGHGSGSMSPNNTRPLMSLVPEEGDESEERRSDTLSEADTSDTDSVTSLAEKLDEAATTLERARLSLPAVGIEQQHVALQEENSHLRELMSDLIIHGKDFVTHHEQRSERDHKVRLAASTKKQRATKASASSNTGGGSSKTCTIL